ncbi:gluconate 2-dehydrogenase subunit 3 family protein [Salinirubellus sp. GCM10025818]|uniref:gluconate 2-dehydrogenase subunit 3 family protein n=1 Tax=Salinirubellus TaxID=2162630 RepID=UPI0030CBBAEE
MELTRRDAILALAGGGLVGSAALAEEVTGGGQRSLSGADREVLRSTAEVLYPTSVTVTDDFVETYVLGRQAVDEEYLTGVTEALETVRSTSRSETGRSYTSLDGGRRDEVLRATEADRAYPDPDGTVAQRIRYYVVDELLYALYSTPKGAGLVGNENPKGHPGGIEIYQRRPEGS